ncbi:hypothetical protein [Actinomadura sp. NEAU-AAG7]|uniref:hypothetical protein n=1 Tax=Actinomadura sp. NEAU-AAG7 TaxID=2839640 RepID=UPI001BE48F20|nr:hypothetical protein [Actinomadura sp. NEAU-AAG7]MBT2212728.1 hypothetical protein [Actinomadura sp. NEAU-AAG7]
MTASPTGLRAADPPLAGRPPHAVHVAHSDRELPLLAVDIAAFGDPRRDDEVQLHLRSSLYARLEEAFTMTGLPWPGCYREDRGDGALVVVPPQVDPGNLLAPLGHHLNAVLRRSNRMASEAAHLRVRVAAHIGRVHGDDNGVAGTSLVHLFRLLEAPAFKRALAASGADVGLLASDHLHGIARACGGFFDPAAYEPLAVRCKETRARAWLWLPGPGARR